MIVNSQKLIQSYVLTSAKYNFSVYEKRIMYRLVQMAQQYLKGQKLDKRFTLSEDLFNRKIVTMPISSFFKKKGNNHTRVKEAFIGLMNKTIEYEDADKRWKLIGLVEKPDFDKGFVRFEIQPQIWDAITQFSKGFSKYELKYAMSFNSAYSMRFYEMFSNNLYPITFTIQKLKERFKIVDKYKRPSDFIKSVIVPAEKELDEKSPFSFKYQLIKTGRKITAIKFFPYKNKNL